MGMHPTQLTAPARTGARSAQGVRRPFGRFGTLVVVTALAMASLTLSGAHRVSAQRPAIVPEGCVPTVGCTDPATGQRYRVVVTSVLWSEAHAAAADAELDGVYGHLATINSAGENAFVAGMMQAAGADWAWLAGSDADVEGTWRWIEGPETGTTFWIGTAAGSPQAGAHTNWNTAEPNDNGGEDNLEMRSDGVWNDLHDQGRVSYVIEFEATVPTVRAVNTVAPALTVKPAAAAASPYEGATISATRGRWVGDGQASYRWLRCDGSGDGCDPIDGATTRDYVVQAADIAHTIRGEVTITNVVGASLPALTEPSAVIAACGPIVGCTDPATGHTYRVVTTRSTWPAAVLGASTSTFGTRFGHLATITSQGESSFVTDLITRAGGGDAWLAGSDEVVEGTWAWRAGPESGAVFWQGDATGSAPGDAFTNWHSGEPNNDSYPYGEDHLLLYLGGTWNDAPSTAQHAYVVEFEPTPTQAPVNITPPRIVVDIGVAIPTATLSVANGTWTNDEAGLTYQYRWLRCDAAGAACSPIAGQAGATYTVTVADVGTTIAVEETASNGYAPSTPAIGAVVRAQTGQLYTTAGEHGFVAPEGVTEIAVAVAGAPGGTGGCAGYGLEPAAGGRGSKVVVALPVTSAELFVTVGGAGGDGCGGAGAGGSNGGGHGGPQAGGGGGASDIRTVGAADGVAASLASRLAVAGGGGGGGAAFPGYAVGGRGGDADMPGDRGTFDLFECYVDGADGGAAGTTEAGGTGGASIGLEDGGSNGTLATGGDGATYAPWADFIVGGGGGGGGLYGGGGGGGVVSCTPGSGGGGGGSTYTGTLVPLDVSIAPAGFVAIAFDRPATTITYTGSATATAGDSVTLSAALTVSATSGSLANRTVTFTLAGKTYDATTNAQGVATTTATAPTAGTYAVGATFTGDGTYAAASATATLTVSKRATLLTYTGPTKVKAGQRASLRVTLTSRGVGVAGQTVSFVLANVPYRAVTDASGVAVATATVPSSKGPYSLTVVFNGDATYAPANLTLKISN